MIFAQQRDVVSLSVAAWLAHGATGILEAGPQLCRRLETQLRCLGYPLPPWFFSSFVAFNEQSRDARRSLLRMQRSRSA